LDETLRAGETVFCMANCHAFIARPRGSAGRLTVPSDTDRAAPAGRLLAVNHTGLYSGAEVVLLRLLDAAAGRGWQVACAAADGPLTRRLAAHGVPRIPLPELKLPAGPKPLAAGVLGLRSARAARRLREAGGGRHRTVLVANGLLALPALRLARAGHPVVWLVHDVLRRPEELALLRLCRSAVTEAIAPSEAVAGPLRAHGVPVRVVRHGTPWPVAPAPDHPGGPRVVGMTALLTGWKGHEVLLEAMARLPPGVRLELVGGQFPKDAGYVERLRRRAAEPDLAGRVSFLGWLDDPLERMRGWDVAVLPSVEPEAVGLAVLEAMSLGVPVVATGHGGPPEFLGDAGLLVPPGDPGALAGVVARLLDDEPLRRRCREAGRQAVAQGLTLEAQQERLLQVLDALADADVQDRGGVVHVVPDFEPWVGGTTRQTGTQARALAARGHRVLVLTRRLDRRWPRRERRDGLEVERVGPARRGALGEKLSVLAVAAWLVRHRRRLGVVQVVMYPDYVLGSLLAGRLRSTAMLWAGQGDATDVVGPAPDPVRRLQHAARRWMLRRCIHVALTPALARELRGLELDSVVIPVPVDRRRFRPPTNPERLAARRRLGITDQFTVAFTGNLRALKGVDRLIEAVAGLTEAGHRVRLLVVGAGTGAADDVEAKLRAQARSAGLEREVTFTGAVDDVAGFLWAADAFVLPSVREGMSNSLVEAMACGLACIAPVTAAGAEVLTAQTGIVPPDNHPRRLSEALAWLADHPADRRAMGAAAADAADAWSLERVIDQYQRLYAGLGKRKGRKEPAHART
jgi:glycosyltransferase involved in cell wall biosynthesis